MVIFKVGSEDFMKGTRQRFKKKSWPCRVACEILVPQQGLNPGHGSENRLLTTGPSFSDPQLQWVLFTLPENLHFPCPLPHPVLTGWPYPGG